MARAGAQATLHGRKINPAGDQQTGRRLSALRQLLIHGARSILLTVDRKSDRTSRWAATLKVRRHKNIAAVAMANKMVRVAFALLKTGETYRAESTQSTA